MNSIFWHDFRMDSPEQSPITIHSWYIVSPPISITHPSIFWHDFRTTPPYTLRKKFTFHCFTSHFEHASQHISGTIFAWIPTSKVLAVTEREKKRRECVLEMLSEMDARKRGCEPKKLACKSSQLLTSHFLLLYRVDSPEQSPHNDYTLSLSKWCCVRFKWTRF